LTFQFTPKQIEAQAILAGPAKHLMLFGGSRSGKTFLLTRNLVMRGLKAKNSRHIILRQRFNAVRAAVMMDTFPKVMRVAFPGVKWDMNKQEGLAYLDGDSEVWFGGLDDDKRVEKILGTEFVTIYLNECSQISYDSRNVALTRLAQQVEQLVPGQASSVLTPRAYYDENPPSKAHWTYKLFVQRVDPETSEALKDPHNYQAFKINPEDNTANIASDYLETLEGMAARHRKRFRDGDFADATPGALFSDEVIEKYRHEGELPDFVRVVVAVDPSGAGDTDNADNDAIGIVVVGLGVDGIAYLLEDCTVKAGPATWGRVATTAFDRHQANLIVGEVNYGGAMVQFTIQASRPRTPFKMVTATRGKHVRADPISVLYEQGKVRHVGRFVELENELTAFNTAGYTGEGSPNRADAAIWALSELFPGIVKPRTEPPPPKVPIPSTRTGFNRR
jgi:phage terminase large subunit-like protein